MVHNAGANIPQHNTANSLGPQTIPVQALHNWPEQFYKPLPFHAKLFRTISVLQTSNFHSSSKYFNLLLISDINHEINAKLVRLNLQTSHFNSQSGQNKSASLLFQLSIWSEQLCKPGIKISQTQSANQWFQFLIWPEQVCKPVISFLYLARTSLQTSDLHSSSSISHVAAHFGYQQIHAHFILHQPCHTLLL